MGKQPPKLKIAHMTNIKYNVLDSTVNYNNNINVIEIMALIRNKV